MGREPETETLASPSLDYLTHLEEQVRCRLGGRVRSFRLLLRGDGLVLQGHAPTYYAKQLAQYEVMQAGRLPIRANEIQVF
jgi:hypothetical protein